MKILVLISKVLNYQFDTFHEDSKFFLSLLQRIKIFFVVKEYKKAFKCIKFHPKNVLMRNHLSFLFEKIVFN